jgi:NAD(P)-dependent dehydrogenase (short-subunit alcohol dehydrogenase family)
MRFFVTGGSRGIGAQIVLAAARAGYDVAFTYRSDAEAAQRVTEQAQAEAPECGIRAYRLDVRDSEAVDAVADRAQADLGDITVVVNNAGVVRAGLAASLSDDDWREVLDTHLSGAFYVCRAFLPTMLALGSGRIINMSSVVAGGMSGMANYAAAKAGLHGLTRTLAKEYGRKGISANCVVAGPVDTDMAQAHLSDTASVLRRSHAPTPEGRLGDPARLAQTVLFLASEAAGDINGAEIVVSGGMDWLP